MSFDDQMERIKKQLAKVQIMIKRDEKENDKDEEDMIR
jgi:hypothetical protein